MRHAYAELDQRVADRTAALERANVALHDSLALLRGVAESTPDLIVVKDNHGRVVMANPAQVKAVGKAEAAIIGHTDREFMDDSALADRIMANDRRVMSSGRVERVEETVSTPEGARTYLSTKSPLRDVHGEVVGVIGVATDITDRKRMENELREAQRFTQGLVETAPIVLYLYDRVQRRIVYATGMGLEALGLSSEDLTSRDAAGLERLIHPEDLPTVIDSLRRGPVAHGSIREVEFRCRTRAGEWRWMHGRERDFEPGDENRLLLGVTVDITDRKVAELERERLMSQEQKLQARSRARQPGEGRVPRDRFTRAALTAQRAARLGFPARQCESAGCGARRSRDAGDQAQRRSSGQADRRSPRHFTHHERQVEHRAAAGESGGGAEHRDRSGQALGGRQTYRAYIRTGKPVARRRRRCCPAASDRRQSAFERGEVHARSRRRGDNSRGCRRYGAHRRVRHRRGHRPRIPAARVRPVHSGRYVHHETPWRPGDRTRTRAASHRAARRPCSRPQ